MYGIETEDIYKEFWNEKDKFDNSVYPENSQYFDKSNKKVMGKFKDEASGMPITGFAGLRSKRYSYTKENNKEGQTCKGIKKASSKRTLGSTPLKTLYQTVVN